MWHSWRKDVEWHVEENGPWPARLAHVDDAPHMTAAVETMVARVPSKVAA
jgi:hypothetical protein